MSEYVTKFGDLNLRCDVNEDMPSLLSRFRTRLRQELQKELLHHRPTNLMEMYERVLDLEKYLKPSFVKHFESRMLDSKPTPLEPKPNQGILF